MLEFIATHVTDNIRELEGALIRVTAFASLNQRAARRWTLAEQVLADILGDAQAPADHRRSSSSTRPPRPSASRVDELWGKSRRRPLVTARQVAMYVFRELTDLSATRPSPGSSAAGTTPPSCTPSRRSPSLMKERRQIYDQVTELVADRAKRRLSVDAPPRLPPRAIAGPFGVPAAASGCPRCAVPRGQPGEQAPDVVHHRGLPVDDRTVVHGRSCDRPTACGDAVGPLDKASGR